MTIGPLELDLTIGSLFSGIGGLELGLEMAGLGETIWQVENNDYCNKVLEKHWPNVRRYRDVREVHGVMAHANTRGHASDIRETLPRREEATISNTESCGRSERGEAIYRPGECPNCLAPVDIICGGWPCQPFSVAGKRRGKEDDRHLWPEYLRIVTELHPTWVIGENVPGIINMELDTVLSDLESQGYETATFIIPACAVDAPHRRDRVFVVANCEDGRWPREEQRILGKQAGETRSGLTGNGEDVADTGNTGLQGREETRDNGDYGSQPSDEQLGRCDWRGGAIWLPEPDVGRVAHGISHRVDRLKCLGNAVVPAVSCAIGRIIKEWIIQNLNVNNRGWYYNRRAAHHERSPEFYRSELYLVGQYRHQTKPPGLTNTISLDKRATGDVY